MALTKHAAVCVGVREWEDNTQAAVHEWACVQQPD